MSTEPGSLPWTGLPSKRKGKDFSPFTDVFSEWIKENPVEEEEEELTHEVREEDWEPRDSTLTRSARLNLTVRYLDGQPIDLILQKFPGIYEWELRGIVRDFLDEINHDWDLIENG